MSTTRQTIHSLWLETPSLGHFVDVHLVVDNHALQYNFWRNIARLYAPTEYILMIDGDFIPSMNFSACMRQHNLMQELAQNRLALVVPAFEYKGKQNQHLPIPAFKSELRQRWMEGKASHFLWGRWEVGHRATNYTRWMISNTSYSVDYEENYEPYVIIHKNAPWYV